MTLRSNNQGYAFSFVYIRSTPLNSEAIWLSENTVGSAVLMGDLNLNPNDPPQRRMMDVIRGQREILLQEITTKHKRNLDHIFGSIDQPAFCQAYLNFISDHFTITIRIGNNQATFLSDKRLKKKKNMVTCPAPDADKDPQTPRKKKNQLQRQTPKKQRSVEN